MTINFNHFIHQPPDDFWHSIPWTWLEADATGRLRDSRTKEWFGFVIHLEDFFGVLEGLLPVYDPAVVEPSRNPRAYFDKRTRDDRRRELEITTLFEEEHRKTVFANWIDDLLEGDASKPPKKVRRYVKGKEFNA